MFEIMENSKKETTVMSEGMLKNATAKINDYHKITKNAILGISLILSDIADKPKEYLENSGFTTIAEYAETMFGYKKAYTYKLVKISKFIKIVSKDSEEDKEDSEENEEKQEEKGKTLTVADLINDKIETDYAFDTIKDSDGFEFSPSQMLELIPLTTEQIESHIAELDSALTCKELRQIVKDIVNPPIEVKGEENKEDSEEDKEDSEENEEKQEEKAPPLTDKERIMQMLEICSTMEDETIKEKIVNVFQKSLKALEKN